MIEKTIDWCNDNRFLVFIGVAALVFGGIWSLNLIPLDALSVQHIDTVLRPWPFDPIYGAWWERVIATGGKAAMEYSVRRYIDAVTKPPIER